MQDHSNDESRAFHSEVNARHTRRAFVSLIGAGGLVLSGCGGGNSGSSGEVAPPPSPAPSGSGIALLAGALGGAGLMEGRGAAARLPLNIAGMTVSPSGEVSLRLDSSTGGTATISNQAELRYTPGKSVDDANTPSSLPSASVALAKAPPGTGGLIPVDSSQTSFYAIQGSRVVLIDAQGNITPLAGTQEESLVARDGFGDEARFLTNPRFMERLPNGDLLISDNSGALRRLVPSTRQVTSWVGLVLDNESRDGQGAQARFKYGLRVSCVDRAGNFYALETSPARGSEAMFAVIRKVSPGGLVSTLNARLSSTSKAIESIAADDAGNIYYIKGSAIMQARPDGTVRVFAGAIEELGFADGPASQARFASPRSLAFDASGNLWVGDSAQAEYSSEVVILQPPDRYRYGNTIRRISPQGEVSTFAGIPGRVQEGKFTDPLVYNYGKLAVDAQGRVFAGKDYQISRFDKANTPPSLVWGSATPTSGKPTAVDFSVAPSGQIFVASKVQNSYWLSGHMIFAVESTEQMRAVAGRGDPYSLGVRLGQLPGSFNQISSLQAIDDKTLLVTSEGAVLKVTL